MLRHTFCHLPGVGPKTEQGLWQRGLTTWQHLLDSERGLPPAKAALAGETLRLSQEALGRGDAEFFASCLPASESWRLYPAFADGAVFLDIETTGLGGPGGEAEVTTIATWDGRDVRTYVQGRNLADFEADMAGCTLLVTYNGRCFDVPILESHYRMRLPKAHIDLRYVLGALGYKGGLKGCERQLGLCRHELDGVDGAFAVLLWHEHQNYADEAALETLLAYNVADVLSLPELLTFAVERRLAQTPFDIPLPPVAPAANPFTAHPAVIERIRRRYGL